MKAAAGDIAELLEIMARLRQPVDGCPWDVAQTFATIAPFFSVSARAFCHSGSAPNAFHFCSRSASEFHTTK